MADTCFLPDLLRGNILVFVVAVAAAVIVRIPFAGYAFMILFLG